MAINKELYYVNLSECTEKQLSTFIDMLSYFVPDCKHLFNGQSIARVFELDAPAFIFETIDKELILSDMYHIEKYSGQHYTIMHQKDSLKDFAIGIDMYLREK